MTGWPATLADPILCGGLVELLLVIGARTWRNVPLGSLLAIVNAAAGVLALALLARSFYRTTTNAVVAIAMTLTAAVGLLFDSSLAPSLSIGLCLTIALWTAATSGPNTSWRATTIFGAVLAAASPALTIPVALVAGWVCRRRSTIHGAGAAGVVVGASLLVQLALPPGRLCVLPHGETAILARASEFVGKVALESGALVLVLAVLGVLSVRSLPLGVRSSFVPLIVASVWGALVTSDPLARVLAPMLLALWVLASVGLADVWRTVGGTRGGRAGATALSIALVVLQVVSFRARPANQVAPDGHERMTLAMTSDVVGALPRGAALVEEDAITDLLTRALPSRMRAGDRFHFVRREPAVLADELRTARIFALPRSQRRLLDLGVEFKETADTSVPGLAEAQQIHACLSPGTEAPTSLAAIAGRHRLSLVATSEDARGPIVILLLSEVPLAPRPVGWPAGALRGFHPLTFDLTSATERAAFDAEARGYQLSAWSLPAGTRYVTRIEAWRTPGSPFVLPIDLGGAAAAGTSRALDATGQFPLQVCPSFPFEVRPLSRRP